VDFLEISNEVRIVEIAPPADLVGKSIAKTDLRNRFHVTIVAIRRGEEVLSLPKADEVIRPDDVLVVLGRMEDCERLTGK
jgi:trk system potassium uptake protein TrkA